MFVPHDLVMLIASSMPAVSATGVIFPIAPVLFTEIHPYACASAARAGGHGGGGGGGGGLDASIRALSSRSFFCPSGAWGERLRLRMCAKAAIASSSDFSTAC